jgi:hypothetical protein
MHAKVVMRKNRRLSRISEARLEEMTEQAVDAYSESERIGWFTMIKENLGVPFETTVLEVLVAVCNRGRIRQRAPAAPATALSARVPRRKVTVERPKLLGSDLACGPAWIGGVSLSL